jgi:hypothetical protein
MGDLQKSGQNYTLEPKTLTSCTKHIQQEEDE